MQYCTNLSFLTWCSVFFFAIFQLSSTVFFFLFCCKHCKRFSFIQCSVIVFLFITFFYSWHCVYSLHAVYALPNKLIRLFTNHCKISKLLQYEAFSSQILIFEVLQKRQGIEYIIFLIMNQKTRFGNIGIGPKHVISVNL